MCLNLKAIKEVNPIIIVAEANFLLLHVSKKYNKWLLFMYSHIAELNQQSDWFND